ncbi:MAG TPA: TolC family protein [Acidobacteriota bacterium]|nr:TolC family protein [Acidobacteriota bacterium]
MTKLVQTPILVFAACMVFAGVLSASEQSGSQPEVRTMTIQETIRLALSRSPEVLAAEAQAARAREALRESRSANMPRLFAGTGLAYNNGMPLSIDGAAPSIFQVSASQPIFSKTNANLIRETEESGKAGQLGAESVRNEMALRTASVYFDLFQAGKVQALLSAKLDAAIKQQKQTETLLEAGKVLQVDVMRADTAVLAVRQPILVAQEQAAIADKELHMLTGLSDTIRIQTVEPQIDSPIFELQEEAIIQRAVQNSPRILKAEAEVRAKEFHIEAERGGYLPKIEIIGQYAMLSRTNNYEDYFNRFMRHNYLLGLSIQAPVFNKSTAARVAQSRQEAAEARYRFEGLKSDLKLDIQRSLGNLRIARGDVDLRRSDLSAARETVKVSETLLEAGRISEKDLEASRSQLLQKELALIDADRALFQQKMDLLHSSGAIATAIQ